MVVLSLLLLVAISARPADADWWDDFVGKIHEKLVAGADFIRDEAGPAIREKFDDAKQKLQDPETHEQAQTWIKEVG